MSDERRARVESIIHRGAQSVINEGFSDPRLEEAMITITGVKVDRDQTTAVIRVSVMPENREKRAIAGLKSAARHIRRRTADRVNLHRMPNFQFAVDKAAKRQAGVLEALAKARTEHDDKGTRDATEPDGAPMITHPESQNGTAHRETPDRDDHRPTENSP